MAEKASVHNLPAVIASAEDVKKSWPHRKDWDVVERFYSQSSLPRPSIVKGELRWKNCRRSVQPQTLLTDIPIAHT